MWPVCSDPKPTQTPKVSAPPQSSHHIQVSLFPTDVFPKEISRGVHRTIAGDGCIATACTLVLTVWARMKVVAEGLTWYGAVIHLAVYGMYIERSAFPLTAIASLTVQ